MSKADVEDGVAVLAGWLRRYVEAGAKGDERRQHERAPLQTEAELVPFDQDGKVHERRRRPAVVVDVSQSGARFVATASVRSGPVRIRIGPEDVGVVLNAEVLECERRSGQLYVVRVRFLERVEL